MASVQSLVYEIEETLANVRSVRNLLEHDDDRQPSVRDRRDRTIRRRPPSRTSQPTACPQRRSDPWSRSQGRSRGHRSNAASRPDWWSSASRRAATRCERRRARRRCESSRGNARSRAPSTAVRRRRRNSCADRRRTILDRASHLARAPVLPSSALAYTAASRSRCAGGKKNCVSVIPSGAGDARAHELVERRARHALDDAAENVGVVAVDPRLTGLRDKRQRAERLHRRANRLGLVRGVPAKPGRRAEALGLIETPRHPPTFRTKYRRCASADREW